MYSTQTTNGLGVTDGSGTINPAALSGKIPVAKNESRNLGKLALAIGAARRALIRGECGDIDVTRADMQSCRSLEQPREPKSRFDSTRTQAQSLARYLRRSAAGRYRRRWYVINPRIARLSPMASVAPVALCYMCALPN
jgi:hypothetical protein